MPLVAVGINHKTAPIDIRERVAFPPNQLSSALADLSDSSTVTEAAILSTCNRTELLCSTNSDDGQAIIEWLSCYHKIDVKDIAPYTYSHPNQQAVRHLLRVASGLDSLVLGEPQILGQIKESFILAQKNGTAGKLLSRLFQHTLSVAKQVRTDTAIGKSPVSVAFAAVSLAKQIFSDLSQHTVLLIGAGETIELTARHLRENGVNRIIVANRTLERANALAQDFNASAIALSAVPTHLAEADIIISSTASQLPILGKGAVESALKTRKHRPIFMVDIAVPRDIEPEVADLEDIYLYTVDDLQGIIDEGLKSRQEAALQAEDIIEIQTNHFMGWLRSLDTVDVIRDYRAQAELISAQETKKAQMMLSNGAAPEEVIKNLARSLTNKLTHEPTAHIRRAGHEGNTRVIDTAQEILGINKNRPKTE